MMKHLKYLFLIMFFIRFTIPVQGQQLIDITINPDSIINQSFQGLGVEWDPFFWFNGNQSKGLTESDWELIIERTKQMKLSQARIFVLPNWYEPVNDNSDAQVTDTAKFKFRSSEMLGLYRYLDVCDSLDIDVNLTIWGARNDRLYGLGDYWLAFSESNNWITAPNDLDEWAENVTALLNYLFHVRNYKCITHLTMSNEPNPPHQGFWTPSAINKKQYYLDMYKLVHRRLIENGLRDKIKLVGADEADTDDFSWFTYMAENSDSAMDILASHTYAFDIDQSNYAVNIRNWVRRRMNALGDTGKPFFITEFGTNNGIGPYENPDVDTYERGFFLADFVINSMNEGASLLSYWTLHDIWYQYGKLMQLGLWAYNDQQWRLRPSWYVWSLMSRFITKNSMVIDVGSSQSDLVDATAVMTNDGKLIIIVANRDTQDQIVRVTVNDSGDRKFKKYIYDRTIIDSLSDGLLPESGIFTDTVDTLYAQSITLYSEVSPSEVKENLGLGKPHKFRIIQNYPNPFNPSTMVKYELPEQSNIKIEIFNMLGQSVGVLANSEKQAGFYEVMYAENLPSGVYLISIIAEGSNSHKSFLQVKKALLLK